MRSTVWATAGLALIVWMSPRPASATEPLPLSAYGQLPGLDHPSLSPSGKRVAMMVTLDDASRIVVIELETSKVLLSTPIGEVKARDVKWAGEDLVVVTTSNTRDMGWEYYHLHEVWGLVVLNLKQAKATWPLRRRDVFDGIGSLRALRQIDGKWMAYVDTFALDRGLQTGSLHLDTTALQLTRIDLSENKVDRVARVGREGRGWLVGPEGELLANNRYDDREQKWTLYAGADFSHVLLEKQDRFGGDGIIGLGRTPGTVLYQQYDENNDKHVMEAALDGSTPTQEVFAGINIDRWLFDPRTCLLSGYERQSEASEPEFF